MTAFSEKESAWVERVALYRSKNSDQLLPANFLECPAVTPGGSDYERFISGNKLGEEERLLLHLCYMTLLFPRYISSLTAKANYTHGQASENVTLGAFQGAYYPGVLPSAYFFIYLAGGLQLAERERIAKTILGKGYVLLRNDVVELIQPVNAETALTGYFRLRPEYFLQLSSSNPIVP